MTHSLTDDGTVAAALNAYDFQLERTGGNCTAYTRLNGTATECITTAGGNIAPKHWDDDADLTVNAYGTRYYSFVTVTALIDHLNACRGALTPDNLAPWDMTEAAEA